MSLRTVLKWCAVMSVISCLSWASRGQDRELPRGGATLRSSARQVSHVYGPTSDAAHYIQAGEELHAREVIHEHYRRYWGLGTPVVIAAVKTVFGLEASYPWHMALVCTLFFGAALGLIVSFLAPRGRPLLGVLGATALWICADLRDFVFGLGSILSDSMGTAALLAALTMLLVASATPRRRYFVLAGVCFGVAANFRYQHLMLARLVLGAVLVTLVLLAWRAGYGRARLLAALLGRDGADTWLAAMLRGITPCVLAFALLLVPWSAYKLAHDGTLKWYTASQRLKYGRMWTPDAQQPSWAHAANAQCHADPELCAELYARFGEEVFGKLKPLAIVTTILHPIAVARVKLAGFSWLWWGKSYAELRAHKAALVEGLALLGAGLFGVVLLAWRGFCARHPAYLIAGVVVLVVLAQNLVMFTFVHFEWRYSLPLRVLGGLAPLLVAGFAWRLKGRSSV